MLATTKHLSIFNCCQPLTVMNWTELLAAANIPESPGRDAAIEGTPAKTVWREKTKKKAKKR